MLVDFLQTVKTILMNYSCLDSHVRSKPRGETRMVPEVYSVANPFLFYLWLEQAGVVRARLVVKTIDFLSHRILYYNSYNCSMVAMRLQLSDSISF